jgi:PIN domain nuclease of toxin-antitoxin system
VSVLLLDTHILLWVSGQSHRLSTKARDLLGDERNILMFSAISIWEVAIKYGLDRKDFRADPRRLRRGLLDAGFREIGMTSEHAIAAGRLPALHKDPFDRILIAQADVEGAMLLTADSTVARYGKPVMLVA